MYPSHAGGVFYTLIRTHEAVEALLPKEQIYWAKDGYDNVAFCEHPDFLMGLQDATKGFTLACWAEEDAYEVWFKIRVSAFTGYSDDLFLD